MVDSAGASPRVGAAAEAPPRTARIRVRARRGVPALKWPTLLAAAAVVIAVAALACSGPTLAAPLLFAPAPLFGAAGGAARRPVHVYFAMDASGSMHDLKEDVVGGFNQYVAEQREEAARLGRGALLTLAQFAGHDPHNLLFDARGVAAVPRLTGADYAPHGATPLYDAVARLIARADAREAADPGGERPVVVIFTDGLENASREHTRSSVLELIEARKKAGWAFVFLGANQDAFAEGARMGYGRGSTQNFHPDKQGTRAAYSSLSKATRAYHESAALEDGAATPIERDTYRQQRQQQVESFFSVEEGGGGAQQDFESRELRGRGGSQQQQQQ